MEKIKVLFVDSDWNGMCQCESEHFREAKFTYLDVWWGILNLCVLFSNIYRKTNIVQSSGSWAVTVQWLVELQYQLDVIRFLRHLVHLHDRKMHHKLFPLHLSDFRLLNIYCIHSLQEYCCFINSNLFFGLFIFLLNYY